MGVCVCPCLCECVCKSERVCLKVCACVSVGTLTSPLADPPHALTHDSRVRPWIWASTWISVCAMTVYVLYCVTCTVLVSRTFNENMSGKGLTEKLSALHESKSKD